MKSYTIPPRAILFDWDNTLVDSWICIQESYNRTFRHFSMVEWSMETTRANVAKSLRDSFPSMFGDRWEEAKEVFYKSYEDIHLSHLHPLPGAAEMLAALVKSGIYLGVVSNKVGPFLRKEADILGWTPLFGALVGATDAEADKPHPAPVHMALAPSGIAAAKDVWFVGDSAVDLECGLASGCVPILLRPEPPQSGEFASTPPQYHVAQCGDLARLVAELQVPISRF
jgi:phosphoglycolate phosphatase